MFALGCGDEIDVNFYFVKVTYFCIQTIKNAVSPATIIYIKFQK
jgi:hypothetical protein